MAVIAWLLYWDCMPGLHLDIEPVRQFIFLHNWPQNKERTATLNYVENQCFIPFTVVNSWSLSYIYSISNFLDVFLNTNLTHLWFCKLPRLSPFDTEDCESCLLWRKLKLQILNLPPHLKLSSVNFYQRLCCGGKVWKF
jgi:hypothetical protein